MKTSVLISYPHKNQVYRATKNTKLKTGPKKYIPKGGKRKTFTPFYSVHFNNRDYFPKLSCENNVRITKLSILLSFSLPSSVSFSLIVVLKRVWVHSV